MRGQIRTSLRDETLRVKEVAVCQSILTRETVVDQRIGKQIGDAAGSLAGAEEEELLIGHLFALDAHGTVHARDDHRGRTLNVVIEAKDLFLIVRKQLEGVGIAEVLELDEDVGPAAAGFGDEFVNELTIFRTAAALLAQTKVQRIVQIFFAVRADVENDRQRLFRSNAGAGGIERELAAGNAHAVKSLVAQTQNAFAVRDDDHVDLLVRCVFNHFAHVAEVFERNKKAARIAEDMAETLAVFADRRGVDDRHVFGGVSRQQLEEQIFIRVADAVEEECFVDRLLEAVKHFTHAFDLLVNGRNGSRQQTAQAVFGALFLCECFALIDEGAVEDGRGRKLVALSHGITSLMGGRTADSLSRDP